VSAPSVRVVVVDDSPTARLALRMALEREGVQVIGEASHGDQALRMVRSLKPDLVTMDVYLPTGDGIEVTRRIMTDVPTPVLMVTSLDPRDRTLVYRAMEAGALDVLGKPPPPGNPAYADSCKRLARMVRSLSSVPVIRRRGSTASDSPGPVERPPSVPAPRPEPLPSPIESIEYATSELVLVGSSTGGPVVVRDLFLALPRPLPAAFALVQHMMTGFIAGFADWLASETRRRVVVVKEPVRIEPDTIYVAADELHLVMQDASHLMPTDAPPVGFQRPSVDVLFESGAKVLGSRACGVLLTGMGRDGAAGLLSLRKVGAMTIAQSPASCTVAGMPGAAIALGAAEVVAAPLEIAALLGRKP